MASLKGGERDESAKIVSCIDSRCDQLYGTDRDGFDDAFSIRLRHSGIIHGSVHLRDRGSYSVPEKVVARLVSIHFVIQELSVFVSLNRVYYGGGDIAQSRIHGSVCIRHDEERTAWTGNHVVDGAVYVPVRRRIGAQFPAY